MTYVYVLAANNPDIVPIQGLSFSRGPILTHPPQTLPLLKSVRKPFEAQVRLSLAPERLDTVRTFCPEYGGARTPYQGVHLQGSSTFAGQLPTQGVCPEGAQPEGSRKLENSRLDWTINRVRSAARNMTYKSPLANLIDNLEDSLWCSLSAKKEANVRKNRIQKLDNYTNRDFANQT